MAKKAINPLEHDPEALEAHLEQMERKFDRLKSLYESHFVGIEKQAPHVQRRELNRLITVTQQLSIGKATMRFRFQTLNQRWVTYIAYWNRTLREIEGGTYRRDVARARRMMQQKGEILNEEQALAMGIPPNRVKAFVQRHNRNLGREQGAPIPQDAMSLADSSVFVATGAQHLGHGYGNGVNGASSGASSIQGLSETDLQDFYHRYQQARKKVGDTRPLRSLDDLRARLAPQIEKVLQSGRVKRACLEVEIEDGKVKVRARPVTG